MKFVLQTENINGLINSLYELDCFRILNGYECISFHSLLAKSITDWTHVFEDLRQLIWDRYLSKLPKERRPIATWGTNTHNGIDFEIDMEDDIIFQYQYNKIPTLILTGPDLGDWIGRLLSYFFYKIKQRDLIIKFNNDEYKIGHLLAAITYRLSGDEVGAMATLDQARGA